MCANRVVENLMSHFTEIEVSPTMLSEHLADKYYLDLADFWEDSLWGQQ